MNKDFNKKIKIVFLLFTFYFLLSTLSVFAQFTPQFLVSWNSQSYTPNWYNGKIGATYGSSVNISFELIVGGKVADISKTGIRWYKNDKLVKNENNGLGIKNYSFINNTYGEDDIEIRISIPDYKGNTLDKIIKIPVKSPEVILDTKRFDRKLSKGVNPITLWPFFFNVIDNRELSFNLSSDKGAVSNLSNNSSIFNLELNQNALLDTGVRLQAIVKNIKNAMESASRMIQYNIE